MTDSQANKTAEEILSEVSGLHIETIRDSYSWAVRAMQSYATQQTTLAVEEKQRELDRMERERERRSSELTEIILESNSYLKEIEELKKSVELGERLNQTAHEFANKQSARIKQLEEGIRGINYLTFHDNECKHIVLGDKFECDCLVSIIKKRIDSLLSGQVDKEERKEVELMDGDVLIGLKNFSMTDSKYQFLTKDKEYPVTGFTDGMVIIQDDAESDHYFTLDPADVSYWEKFLKLKPRP